MVALSVAGVSMMTVLPRTPNHIAWTVCVPVCDSGTLTISVVGIRPGLTGFGSL
jgi:hypothetical protein